MWRRPAYQTLPKALDISSVTARVAPDLLKAIAILSDTTVRRSAVCILFYSNYFVYLCVYSNEDYLCVFIPMKKFLYGVNVYVFIPMVLFYG